MSVSAPDRSRYMADLSLLLTAAVWGLSFTILKSILGHQVSPLFFVLVRFSVAAIILFPVCRGSLARLDRGGLIGGICLGVLLFLGFVTQTLGIEYTTASRSAFITALSALFVPVFFLIHKRKFPPIVTGVAILIAILGIYLMTGPAGGDFNRGDFLTLICAVAFGAQFYVMGIVTPGRNTLALTFVELTTTAALAALFLPLESIRFELSLEFVAMLLFMGLFATAGALLIQTWAQKKTSAVKAGLILTAEPVFAYMFASALLGEYFNSIQKLGGVLVILAVITAEIWPVLIRRPRQNPIR